MRIKSRFFSDASKKCTPFIFVECIAYFYHKIVIAAVFLNAWFFTDINWFYYNSLKIDYILVSEENVYQQI